jgi:GT2 family glycosyltransferase/glycosyltransferase involved in cell wall biosynthesis
MQKLRQGKLWRFKTVDYDVNGCGLSISGIQPTTQNHSAKFGYVENANVPYSTLNGMPLVVFCPTHEKNSENIIGYNIAKEFFNDYTDCRIKNTCPNTNTIENIHEWLKLRKFLFQLPSKPYAGIFVGKAVYPEDSNLKYIGQVEFCDSFWCYYPEHVNRWNKTCNHVYTISNYSVDVLKSRGVKNVKLLPLGVDRSVFQPQHVESIKLDDPFRIIYTNGPTSIDNSSLVFFMAGMMQHRKAVPETIHAYVKAFAGKYDVLLWIHGRISGWGNDFSRVMQQYGSLAPPMLWTDGAITDEEMSRCLNRTDVYLSPHKLEGFGLMPLQAMACGTPSIITPFSGPADYANKYNSLLLPYELEIAKRTGIPDGVVWARWKEDDLIDLMRLTYNDNSVVDKLSGPCRVHATELGWENTKNTIQRQIWNNCHLSSRKSCHDNPVDILVCSKNSSYYIPRFINSLRNVDAGRGYNLIIHDDASDDNTPQILSDLNVKFIRSEKSSGLAAARNRLLQESTSKYIFICDIDLEFIQKDWLINLVRSYNEHSCGIVSPLLVYSDGMVQSAGGDYSEFEPGIPSGHRFYRRPVTQEVLQGNYVLYAPTAAWLTTRKMIDMAGGFFEAYTKTCFEDVDFCFYIKKLGYKVWYEPSVEIIHHEGSYRKQNPDNQSYVQNRELFKKIWLNHAK